MKTRNQKRYFFLTRIRKNGKKEEIRYITLNTKNLVKTITQNKKNNRKTKKKKEKNQNSKMKKNKGLLFYGILETNYKPRN